MHNRHQAPSIAHRISYLLHAVHYRIRLLHTSYRTSRIVPSFTGHAYCIPAITSHVAHDTFYYYAGHAYYPVRGNTNIAHRTLPIVPSTTGNKPTTAYWLYLAHIRTFVYHTFPTAGHAYCIPPPPIAHRTPHTAPASCSSGGDGKYLQADCRVCLLHMVPAIAHRISRFLLQDTPNIYQHQVFSISHIAYRTFPVLAAT